MRSCYVQIIRKPQGFVRFTTLNVCEGIAFSLHYHVVHLILIEFPDSRFDGVEEFLSSALS